MPVPAKPQVGDPAFPFLGDTEMWSTLIDIIADYRAGQLGNNGGGRKPIVTRGRNETTSPFEKGVPKVYGALETPPNSDDFKRMYENTPVAPLTDPVWPSSIERIVTTPHQILKESSEAIGLNRLLAIDVPGVTAADRYVFIDPADTTKFKANKTSGIYRIVGLSHDTTVIVDLLSPQNIWMFQQSGSVSNNSVSGALYDLEGTDFSGTVTVKDPTGLDGFPGDGKRGLCLNVGNNFYLMGGGGGMTCQGLLNLFADPTCDICFALCERCPQFSTLSGECEEQQPSACDPSDVRQGARIRISGLADCAANTPGGDLCDGEIREFSWFNGTYDVPVPVDWDGTQELVTIVLDGPSYICRDPGPPPTQASQCEHVFKLTLEVTFNCSGGSPSQLGYSAEVIMNQVTRTRFYSTDPSSDSWSLPTCCDGLSSVNQQFLIEYDFF